MNFSIIPGTPQYYKGIVLTEEDLSSAIESLYPMDTDDAILYWNHHPISMSYKYDISVNVTDILDLVCFLKRPPPDELKISFPSNTFSAVWRLSTDEEGFVLINAYWRSVVHPEQIPNYETVLNMHKELAIPIALVVEEWGKVLFQVYQAFCESEVTLSDSFDFQRLEQTLKV